MPTLKRYDIKKLLANPDLRRRLIVESTRVTQAREDIQVSREQVENSYYVVTEAEKTIFFGLAEFRQQEGDIDGRHLQFVRTVRGESHDGVFEVASRDFRAVEGAPLAYSRIAAIAHVFRENPALEPGFGYARMGGHTSADERLVRYWWEVIGCSRKPDREFLPFAKGGPFSRFYCDIFLRISWDPQRRSFHNWFGREGRQIERPESLDDYFKPGLTWPRRTAKGLNVRRLPQGCVFADKGPVIFGKNEQTENYLLGVANTNFFEYLFRTKTSFSWEVGIMKTMPIPEGTLEQRNTVGSCAKQIHDAKAAWDTGSEVSSHFEQPWLLQTSCSDNATTLVPALDAVLAREAALDAELAATYRRLNEAVYRLYGVNDALRARIEPTIGERPPEVVWPQMEGRTVEQKRMEHVCRLLSYTVKCVVEEDDDGLVSLQSVAQELPLLERVRAKLATFFPEQDPHTLEIEIVNELKKRVKGYRRTEALQEWLTDAFFDFHCDLYQQRPILWNLASSQDSADPAFSVIVHYHRFDYDLLAKLRSVHLRDRMTTLRREAAQAGKDGREDDRLQLLAAVEEVEAFDRKLARLQEGHHSGAEGGDEDYRILTSWKKPEDRPNGWRPDLDDGVKVNIAPLARTGLLRIKNKFGQKEAEE